MLFIFSTTYIVISKNILKSYKYGASVYLCLCVTMTKHFEVYMKKLTGPTFFNKKRIKRKHNQGIANTCHWCKQYRVNEEIDKCWDEPTQRIGNTNVSYRFREIVNIDDKDL